MRSTRLGLLGSVGRHSSYVLGKQRRVFSLISYVMQRVITVDKRTSLGHTAAWLSSNRDCSPQLEVSSSIHSLNCAHATLKQSLFIFY